MDFTQMPHTFRAEIMDASISLMIKKCSEFGRQSWGKSQCPGWELGAGSLSL